MSDKYIIRNCNVLYFNPDKTAICNDLNLECPCECKERADCVMKQIVELCKEDWEDMTVSKFQSELLNKLDIQEFE